MRRNASIGTILIAATILVALGTPFALEQLPRSTGAEEHPCEETPDRCAGLWSATCCDFTSPRARIAQALEAPPASTDVAPVFAATLPTRSIKGGHRTGWPPGGRITGLELEVGLFSTVLRL